MSLRPHAEAGTNLKVYSVKSEWKALVDTVRIKSADFKDKFCSRVLRLSEPPRWSERPQTAIRCFSVSVSEFPTHGEKGENLIISAHKKTGCLRTDLKSFLVLLSDKI